MAEDHVYFELKGSFSIVRSFYSENLPEISRRAAIIMACHLFQRIDSWDRLRPYVASYLHRAVSSSNVVSFMSSLDRSLGQAAFYVPGCPLYVKASKRTAHSEVQGHQELVVGKGFSVLIRYHLSVDCSLDRLKSDLADVSLAAEPHYSWWDLIRAVDCASPSKMPFVAIVDKAICSEIQRNPLVCLAER